MEKMAHLESSLLLSAAQSSEKIARLEASLVNLGSHVQGFPTGLAPHRKQPGPLELAISMHQNLEEDRLGQDSDGTGAAPLDPAARARFNWKRAYWLVTRTSRLSSALYGVLGPRYGRVFIL